MDSTSTAVVGMTCAAAYFLDKAVAVQNELLAALAAACLFVYIGNRIVLFSEEPDEQDDEHDTDGDNSGADEDEEREDDENSGADEDENQADDEREDDEEVEPTRLNIADGIEPTAGAEEWNHGREILDALAEEEYDIALSLLGELATGSLAVVAPYVTDKNHSLGCRLRASQHDELVEEGGRVLGKAGMDACPCRYCGSIGIVSFVDSDMNLREKEETISLKLSSHDVDMLLATE